MSVDEGGRAPETLVCPACKEQCRDPRALAVHQERHRPVDPPTIHPQTQRETSHPCSAGCGRNFVSLAQYREHAPICDGRTPLEPFLDNRKTDVPKGREINCPECMVRLPDLELMAVHIERHREVLGPVVDQKTGEVMSRPCPKDCGRNFLSKREFKEHTEICDGSKPLPAKQNGDAIVIIDNIKDIQGGKTAAPIAMAEEITLSKGGPKKEGDQGMLTCTECDPPRKFSYESWYARHMKKAHNKIHTPTGKPGRKPRGEKESPPRDSETPAPPAGAPGPVGSESLSVAALKEKAVDMRKRADRVDEIANTVDLLMKEAAALL